MLNTPHSSVRLAVQKSVERKQKKKKIQKTKRTDNDSIC